MPGRFRSRISRSKAFVQKQIVGLRAVIALLYCVFFQLQVLCDTIAQQFFAFADPASEGVQEFYNALAQPMRV